MTKLQFTSALTPAQEEQKQAFLSQNHDIAVLLHMITCLRLLKDSDVYDEVRKPMEKHWKRLYNLQHESPFYYTSDSPLANEVDDSEIYSDPLLKALSDLAEKIRLGTE